MFENLDNILIAWNKMEYLKEHLGKISRLSRVACNPVHCEKFVEILITLK